MTLNRKAQTAIALSISFVLSASLYVHEKLQQVLPGTVSVGNDQCNDPAAVAQNPNQLLFIGCGGSLD